MKSLYKTSNVKVKQYVKGKNYCFDNVIKTLGQSRKKKATNQLGEHSPPYCRRWAPLTQRKCKLLEKRPQETHGHWKSGHQGSLKC